MPMPADNHQIPPACRTQFVLSVQAVLGPEATPGLAEFVAGVFMDVLELGALQEVYALDRARKPQGYYGYVQLVFEGGVIMETPVTDRGRRLNKSRTPAPAA